MKQTKTTKNEVKTKSSKLINKKTPWTKIDIEVDLKINLTRKVLFEKCFPKKSKEIEMTEFIISKLDGCELYLNCDYPDYVFYVKKINDNQEILIQKHERSKIFFVKYSNFWQILENKYRLSYTEAQTFTQYVFEDLLKSQGYKTRKYFLNAIII